MPTINQLLKTPQQKIKKNPKKVLTKCPQKKGICIKVFIMTPKKPNSALRKVVRVRLSNNKYTTSSIPGIGHKLQKYSNTLIRGGRVRDLVGIRTRCVRNKYDLEGVYHRTQARSKYGIRSFKAKNL